MFPIDIYLSDAAKKSGYCSHKVFESEELWVTVGSTNATVHSDHESIITVNYQRFNITVIAGKEWVDKWKLAAMWKDKGVFMFELLSEALKKDPVDILHKIMESAYTQGVKKGKEEVQHTVREALGL